MHPVIISPRKNCIQTKFSNNAPKLSLQPYSPNDVYKPVARVNMSKWKKYS